MTITESALYGRIANGNGYAQNAHAANGDGANGRIALDNGTQNSAHLADIAKGPGLTLTVKAESENVGELTSRPLLTMNGNGETTNGHPSDELHLASEGHVIKDSLSDYGDVKGVYNLDEYDVNFSDTRKFAVRRWNDIRNSVEARLLPSDLKIVGKYHDWEHLSNEIQTKMADPTSTTLVKREMQKIQQMPKSIGDLINNFTNIIVPFEVRCNVVWALIHLNLKLSYASPDRLTRTVKNLVKVKRITDLFNRCIKSCDEVNESRIAVVDFLDPLTTILTESTIYLRDFSSDKAANDAWPAVKVIMNEQINCLNDITRHLNDITSLSKVNQDRNIKNMSLRHALIPEAEEHGTFPNLLLPTRVKNENFYGRKDELQMIANYLKPKGDQSFRTFSIYGRRGVGKTEIALQFALTNPCAFDAIFWIQCETSVAIRQSFTKVAVALNLPGADSDGHHEENLLKVHDWLKRTKKRWLLIFDNAERDQTINQYWPVGSSGALLTTSRQYYNFVKDTDRKGQTIKPFTSSESWDLLLQLLGEDWKKMDRENRISPSEVTSAKAMLSKLGGLALAIQQAAELIKNPNIGGPTITKTYEMFEKRLKLLPERHSSKRSALEAPLDALWDMIFNALSQNGRVLLGVLSWLSPDLFQSQMFMPRNQAVLNGSLTWCKQENVRPGEKQIATLYDLITPAPAFEAAIRELVDKKLIKQTGPRLYSIHRVVQEAMNWKSIDELQASFETAARLVCEQFPTRRKDDSLFNRWTTCQDYIQHGVQLSKKFDDYANSSNLKGSPEFVELLSNCAWYLHELGHYKTCLKVLESAKLACTDKSTLEFAELRNIDGARFYELNLLKDCREAWEECLKIREENLPYNDIQIAAIYNNLGNLELAQGDTEDAIDYFNRATQIWVDGGDATASRLALTYLCMGRVRMLQARWDEAIELTAWAEDLFIRTTGKDKGFMANVYYAYGNIRFKQKKYGEAWRDYDACLKICLQNMSIHPITAAAYYSLGRIEFVWGNLDNAKNFLDKAKSIQELRSPDRDDGHIARTLWMTSVVLRRDPLDAYAKEADEMQQRAAIAQQKLLAGGEGGSVPRIEDDDEENDEKYSYDSLVPLFFR